MLETLLIIILKQLDYIPLILLIVLRCDRKCSVVFIQARHMDLLPWQAWGRLCQWFRLCDWTCHHKLINWMHWNSTKFFLLIVVYIVSSSEEEIYKEGYWFIIITHKILFCYIVIRVWWSYSVFEKILYQGLWSIFGGHIKLLKKSWPKGH